MTTVSCHQPNFIPWFGFFKKLCSCDVFVLLDDVQPPLGKSRHNYINRVQIADLNGPFWLTVPIMKRSDPQVRITDLQIDRSRFEHWMRKTIKSLRATYARSPHSDTAIDMICDRLDYDGVSLVEFNLRLLRGLCETLAIEPQFVFSSTLAVSSMGSERLAKIVSLLEGDTYLSGSGAVSYMDQGSFDNFGIRVEYCETAHPVYEQMNTTEFHSGLSIIDAICNLGSQRTSSLLRE
jgi:hypothetical protein